MKARSESVAFQEATLTPPLKQGQTFSLKDQIVNILGVEGHRTLVITVPLSREGHHRKHVK